MHVISPITPLSPSLTPLPPPEEYTLINLDDLPLEELFKGIPWENFFTLSTAKEGLKFGAKKENLYPSIGGCGWNTSSFMGLLQATSRWLLKDCRNKTLYQLSTDIKKNLAILTAIQSHYLSEKHFPISQEELHNTHKKLAFLKNVLNEMQHAFSVLKKTYLLSKEIQDSEFESNLNATNKRLEELVTKNQTVIKYIGNLIEEHFVLTFENWLQKEYDSKLYPLHSPTTSFSEQKGVTTIKLEKPCQTTVSIPKDTLVSFGSFKYLERTSKDFITLKKGGGRGTRQENLKNAKFFLEDILCRLFSSQTSPHQVSTVASYILRIASIDGISELSRRIYKPFINSPYLSEINPSSITHGAQFLFTIKKDSLIIETFVPNKFIKVESEIPSDVFERRKMKYFLGCQQRTRISLLENIENISNPPPKTFIQSTTQLAGRENALEKLLQKNAPWWKSN